MAPKELRDAKASHEKHHAKTVKLAHPDEKQDRKLVDKMVKKDALTGRSCGGSAKRASGGTTKAKADSGKKPRTQVNIVVAPKGQGQAGPAQAPMPGPAGVAPSRPAGPVVPPPSGPSGPTPAGGLAALGRPGAKCGGKIARAIGGKITGYDAGSGSGEGRLEKERKERRK